MQQAEFLKLNFLDPSRPIVNNLGIAWEIVAYLNQHKGIIADYEKPLLLEDSVPDGSFTETVAASASGEAVISERALFPRWQGLKRQAKLAVRFAVTAGVIFAILYSISNYAALKQIVNYKIQEYSGELFQDPTRQILRDIDQQSGNLSTNEIHGSQESSSVEEVIYDAKKEVLDFGSYSISPPDDRIVIPRINKNIPLVGIDGDQDLINQNWQSLEKKVQDKLLYGAVLYPGTVKPGYFGNTTITAHSSYYPWANPKDYIDAFALLGEMKVGDGLSVFYHGQKYTYKVYDVFEVQPGDTSVIEQNEQRSDLTLITCTPVGTTLKRLIVKAEQVSPDPKKNKKAGPNEILIKAPDHSLQS